MKNKQSNERQDNAKRYLSKNIKREFDPGSGRTLAACLTHASRTIYIASPRVERSAPSAFAQGEINTSQIISIESKGE